MTQDTSSPARVDATIRIGAIEVRHLVDGSGAGHKGLFEMRLPPNTSVPSEHAHCGAEEMLYVLEGRLRHSIGGVEQDLGPGDSAFKPRGAVHSFSNPFHETVRTLTVMAPDLGAQSFREAAAVIASGALGATCFRA